MSRAPTEALAVLQFIAQNPGLRRDQIAERMGRPLPGVTGHTKRLFIAGRITRKTQGKWATWWPAELQEAAHAPRASAMFGGASSIFGVMA
jgi:hypothetical protein